MLPVLELREVSELRADIDNMDREEGDRSAKSLFARINARRVISS
jgi:hypothetical protein